MFHAQSSCITSFFFHIQWPTHPFTMTQEVYIQYKGRDELTDNLTMQSMYPTKWIRPAHSHSWGENNPSGTRLTVRNTERRRRYFFWDILPDAVTSNDACKWPQLAFGSPESDHIMSNIDTNPQEIERISAIFVQSAKNDWQSLIFPPLLLLWFVLLGHTS